jgi:hypothetical protein
MIRLILLGEVGGLLLIWLATLIWLFLPKERSSQDDPPISPRINRPSIADKSD